MHDAFALRGKRGLNSKHQQDFYFIHTLAQVNLSSAKVAIQNTLINHNVQLVTIRTFILVAVLSDK